MIDFATNIIKSQTAQALIIAAVIGIFARIFTPKGKLVWGVSHQHHYRMPRLGESGTFPVVTQQIWFQNLGRLSIENVEIVLNWKPQHFEIWDPRSYEQALTPDGRFVIKIPSLNRTEAFTVSMIDTINDLPAVINVRWNGGLGRMVRMGPQRVFPLWFNYLILALLFISLVSIIFFSLQLAIRIFL